MSNSKNFHAHGGNEWVVGGKLTILPGSVVEGLPSGTTTQVENIPQAEGSTIAELRGELNVLLAALKASGIMTSDE